MTGNVLARVFTIEIGGTPTLSFEAKNHREAQELCREQWLEDDFAEAKSNAVPLWDLVVFGTIGLAFRQRLAPIERTEVANRIEQRRSELEAEIAANRKSKLAEQTKDRRATAKPPPDEHS